MTIYNVYIFDREGQCLFYDEWFRTKQSGLSKIQEYKLVFGMMLSMKSFSERLATADSNQTVNFYKTSTYKMTFLESATGIKILINTDPNANGIRELLHKIYQAWTETANSAARLISSETEPDESFLKSRVKQIVTKHPCYV
ncbi:unnamed protein product [Caenorhabditis angaria]|uniref:Trafficking protein particle complex subunit n=1 Tax=Caenorhabditis angaria TaxID=860376 RepID=A0A9P1N4Q4_9PELO|nr:unnamed protein product [Caenorhabditis angaria]